MIFINNVDLIENTTINKKIIYAKIKEMATESSNYQNFSVLISCSNSNITKDILDLNSKTKIISCGTPTDFKWNYINCKELLNSYCEKYDISDQQKNIILEYSESAACAKFIKESYRYAIGNDPDFNKKIEKLAQKYKEDWDGFENIY